MHPLSGYLIHVIGGLFFYINIPGEIHGNRLEVKIYFDDCLMFADRFESNELPF